MKKYFVCALAALSFAACVNEDGLLSETKGYINLNVNAEENVNITRGTVSTTATDWYVKVNSDAAITVAALAGKAYGASDKNTLSAYNYADMAAALAANDGRGAAYWTGNSGNFAIEAGKSASVTVNCGAAKNAAFDVVYNDNFKAVATNYNLLATAASSRSLEFNTTTNGVAYFEAGEITYTLTATVNSKNVNVSKDLTLEAGTKTTLTVKANTNGTISLTINYNDMTDADAQEITIDAATGKEVTK